MNLTDNKKALNLDGTGFDVVENYEVYQLMTSLALSFNEVNFSPVQQDGQIWLKTSELAEALGYSDQSGVTRIYSRNEDEFTKAMSCSVKLTEKGQTREIRVFSLRGAHLIAMFARTSIAKQFRKWVLDILDREVLGQQIAGRQSISPEQQALLHEIVSRRSKGERKIYAEMWSRHNRHFNIPRYAELLAIHFPESVHYLETMELKAKATENVVKVESEHNKQNLKCLAWHMLWVHQWWKQFGDPIRKISPTMAAAVHDHFQDGAFVASGFLDEVDRKHIREKAGHYPWHLNYNERMALEYKESQK